MPEAAVATRDQHGPAEAGLATAVEASHQLEEDEDEHGGDGDGADELDEEEEEVHDVGVELSGCLPG